MATPVKDRHKIITAVVVMLRSQDKILLLKRKNSGWEDGKFALIGGCVDGNETILDAAVRETMEEVGVKIYKEDLQVVHVHHRKDEVFGETVNFFITVSGWDGDVKIMEPDKCDEMMWCDMFTLPKNSVSYLPEIFDDIARGIFYSEWGWPDSEEYMEKREEIYLNYERSKRWWD